MDDNEKEETTRKSVLFFLVLSVLFAILIGTGVIYLAKSGEKLPAAIPPPASVETVPPAGETPGPPAEGQFAIAAIPTIKFDKADLTIPAGQTVTVLMDNIDTGIPHNFAVYTDRSASQVIIMGVICTAPCQDTVAIEPLQPGEYFFRCDVHPLQMTGKLIAQ
jgi:plastocyanin